MMTPKQRVMLALSHKEPDRVPYGEMTIDYPIIERALGRETFCGAKAKRTKALWDGRRDEVVESDKKDIVEFALKAGLDIVCVGGPAPAKDARIERPKQIDSETWEDQYGNIYKYSAVTENIIQTRPTTSDGLGYSRRLEELRELDLTPDEWELEVVDYVVEKLGKSHFIAAKQPGILSFLRAFPGGRLDLEELSFKIMDTPEKVREENMLKANKLADYVEPLAEIGVDGICLVGDYGSNIGPFISPQHFRQLFFPAMKRECEIIHAHGMPVLFHSCGHNRIILDQFLKAGIDAYHSIQPIEKIDELKTLYRDRLTLWGGLSVDSMSRGTPYDIRQQVMFSLKHCAPGGGFILSAGHSITIDAKYENFMTMLQVLHEHGTYPINVEEEIPRPNWGPT